MTLERHYRRLLRAYPRSYREHRGEEMLAILMDDARPGQRRPGRHETADLLLGGVRERLGLHDAPNLVAGIGLATPVCLAIAAGYAVSLWLMGARSVAPSIVAVTWVLVVVVWATVPKARALPLLAAWLVTAAVMLVGYLGPSVSSIFVPVAAWGLCALGGTVLASGSPAPGSVVGRFGPPVGLALIGGLVVVLDGFPAPVRLAESELDAARWAEVGLPVLVWTSLGAGVLIAAWLRDSRFAWAALVLFAVHTVLEPGSWAPAMTVLIGLPAMETDYANLTGLALMAGATVYLAAAGRRTDGVGFAALHGAGSMALGFAGAAASIVLAKVLADGDDPVVLTVLGLGLLIVPTFTDRWFPAVAQRVTIALAIAAFAVCLFGGLDIRPEFSVAVAVLLLIGMVTRDRGTRDLGALAAWVVGGAAILILVWIGSGPSMPRIDLQAQHVVTVTCLVLSVVAGCAATHFLRGRQSTWRGLAAAALAVLWLAYVIRPLEYSMLVQSGVVATAGVLALWYVAALRRRRGMTTRAAPPWNDDAGDAAVE